MSEAVWKGRVKKICKGCGKEFEVCLSEKDRKFCSLECFLKYRWGRGRKVKRICEYCGKEFEVHEWQVRQGGGKFCSRECQAKYMRKRVKKVCEVCGKEFEVEKRIAEKGGGRFCSRECYVRYVKSEEYKKKKSELVKELWQDPECKKKLSEKVEELWQDPEFRGKVNRQREKVQKSFEFRKKQSEISKMLWQDPEYREKCIRSRVAKAELKPNRLEKAFCDLLLNYFLGEWRYVGDGKVFIAGFVPDFIHREEDWIIELNGNYWHSFPEAKEKDKRKKEIYKRCGYKVLEIWESEFKSDPMRVVRKIVEYFYGEGGVVEGGLVKEGL